jgi:hypothetical protein
MAENKDEPLEESAPKQPTTGEGAPAQDPTLNAIQLAFESSSSSAKPKREKKARARDPKAAAGTPQEKSGQSRGAQVPDSVLERFIQIGNNFYFPDGVEAFSRQENRLTTRSENAIVIQSMVAIAREESPTGVVKVGGTDFFKKEAWFAASLVGLQVQGYTPTEFERERLAGALARRAGKPPDPQAPAPQEKAVSPQVFITGKLVDHGPAPYQHHPTEAVSYFVRIETEKGARDLWGVDLERAFRHSLSNPGIGDEVGIRMLAKEAVTVLAAKRDASGQEIGREKLATHRNQWSVERKEFLEQRHDMATVFRDPSISAADGIKRHAELEGSYRMLEMGQAHAEEQYPSKLHRQQFVDHLREHLAKTIEYGQPLEPVRPRAHEERTPELHEPDRDYHPTR